MAQVRNIIVGAANLFLGRVAGTTPDLPAFVAGEPFSETLAAAATDWRDVGFTNGGLSVAYTPTYTSVTVDQLKDAALMFSTELTIEVSTELAEATLLNLQTSWGQPDDTRTAPTGGLEVSGTTETLDIAAGELGDYPVERSLVAVGNAPRATPTVAVPAPPKRERIYHGRRVISVSASTHALQRTGATTVPVTFRLLPDPAYAGAEYGQVIDRTL